MGSLWMARALACPFSGENGAVLFMLQDHSDGGANCRIVVTTSAHAMAKLAAAQARVLQPKPAPHKASIDLDVC
jgi:hypothetical protein